jgi:ADYC domain-containing protein/pentapeptide repeat protein
MTRFCIICFAALCASYCSYDFVETSTDEQFGSNLQGSNLQGTSLQGSNLQGMSMQGFQFSGATLGDVALVNPRVQQGELVAEQDQVTLRGASLVGAHVFAQVRNLNASPPASAVVEYRITSVVPEDPTNDPTHTGATFLYTLEQWLPDTSSWQPACPVDTDGRRVAIPLAAIWDEHGDRIESTSLFTFGCTTGVIAKCYRWGYRPWVAGYGNLATMHWACTRLARADYCGNGKPHTQDGTWINVWDNLPAPGPIQLHGAHPPPGMIFEAGWNTGGAVCLGRTRWISDMVEIAATCPARLMPLGQAKKICDTVEEALGNDPSVLLFNESNVNVTHP